ncbi:MAG: hypothetical protein PHD15_01925 [Clostridia bacterium]|nr:hypothetical protein [Clostridia bacterium]MDD4386510.1 hypothetical protein [Clostridia bacterium]
MFSNNIRILYLYIVSFLALMAIIFGTITLVERITNYIYPVDYSYDRSYVESYSEKGVYKDEVINTNSIEEQKANAQRATLRDIFTALAVIAVSIPLYSYHWVTIQKERRKEEV